MSLLFGYSSGLSSIEEDLDMSGNRIINLPSPPTGSEPVTKQYADTHYSGGGGGRDPKGVRVTRVILTSKDLKETKVIKGLKEIKMIKVTKDLKEIKVIKGLKETKVTQDLKEIKVIKGLNEIKVTKDLKAIRVVGVLRKVLKATLDHRDQKVT